ncbi:DNA recombination protein RmuC [Jannaschia seohaensis]|uniref:DNA recombination protein RmuC homolog n=1 Tax=Jannaschia seohaensis TaxID=475081 RepID=A0A2Y9A2Z5_9RHOB|nr:DNA recombination protein RmuC [Jannaschia seohaensis]PWJ21988.1 DNA recombination protein RmuC [Jannaschia seohaensis]SSA38266.1 DNA recombination protein RmuC [Jannaschia seohaensis]
MILDLSDPATLGALGAGALALLLLVVVLAMSARLRDLSRAQAQLTGTLAGLADAQARAEAGTAAALTDGAARTAASLGALQQRLAAIDAAQSRIEDLSSNVLGLQDILSNKQTRGAFGEIQLHDLVAKALPPDAFTWQATLTNGRRADCLIHMPDPPGPLVIDAKFPLESYEALLAEPSQTTKTAFRAALRTHIRAIADKYVLPGETADGACLFLPSEAIYAELHANHPEIVREGFVARVWIVSPTTMMATLNTLRAVLKDHRMREQAGDIRRALAALGRDVELIVERAAKLESHFDQARRDVEGIATAAERAGRRAERLDAFDFGEEAAAKPRLAPVIRRG